MPGLEQMDPSVRELSAASLNGQHERVGCVHFTFGNQSPEIFACYRLDGVCFFEPRETLGSESQSNN